MTKQTDDFIAFMGEQASQITAGNMQDVDLLDEEDIEAMIQNLPGDMASMQMIIMNPRLALWFSFMRGVLWARYRLRRAIED